MDKPLANVHEALHDAAFENAIHENEETVIQSFRLKKSEKAKLESICENHSTNPSMFLRMCVRGLLKDYQDPEQQEPNA